MEITHNCSDCRFETTVDGHTAYIEYVDRDGLLDLTHTIVPAPLEGRGIAAALTQHVLAYAHAQKRRVRPSCSFVRVYIERHPEYKELL